MRRIAAVLIITTACRHGRVSVSTTEVASHVAELNANGEATVTAMKQRVSPSWSKSSATIRADQRVEVMLGNVEVDNKLFTGVVTTTFGELLADCPRTPFSIDDATRKANPRCKLIGVGHDASIDIGTTTFPGPWFWGLLGGATGFGVVACASECGSPISELSTGLVIIGGVAAVVAVVGIAALVNAAR